MHITTGDGFAVIFSAVVLPVFTDDLQRNSARDFTKPNKLSKQNEEVSIICRRSMHNIAVKQKIKRCFSFFKTLNRRRN